MHRDRLSRIEHKGVLIYECSLDGEGRDRLVVPAHPNGIRVGRSRWLLLYATRKFRGNDDDCSIIYQIRADSPAGRLVKEGMLAKSIDDWQPLGNGKKYVRQHGHPVAFGVPKGALIGGKPAISANVFVLKWRIVGLEYDAEANKVEGTDRDPMLVARTQSVQWTQVRLNEAEDDIEIIEPVKQFRQKGFESGPTFCSAPGVAWATQNYTQAVPYSSDCTEWVDCTTFDGGRGSAIKHTFNVASGKYEWTETGPFLFPSGAKHRFGDFSLARYGDEWIVAARTDYVKNHVTYGDGLGWVRTEDPFGPPSSPEFPGEPRVQAPINIYTCPDGVLRLLSDDGFASPYHNRRDPMYCWNIDPGAGFRATKRRTVFDTVSAGLPIRRSASPKVDMGKLLMHDGDTQYLLYRVSVISMLHEHVHTEPTRWVFPPVNAQEIDSCAIYCAMLKYEAPFPSPWSFA